MSAYNTSTETDANGVVWVVVRDGSGRVLQRGKADNQPNQGPHPGGPGSYTGGTDANGYGGAGEVAGGKQVDLRGVNMPYFQQDRDRLGGLMGGQSPFASGDWAGVIQQLKDRAAGNGPSMAAMQYQQNMGDVNNGLAGAARGGASPAAFRAAVTQQGANSQGMALGSAMAKTNEMNQAQGQLTSALGTRDQMNQSAYLNILAQQLGLSEAQLKALQGDQNYSNGVTANNNQADANKYQAIAGILGAGAKVAG